MSRRKQVCLFGLSGDPPTGYTGHVGIVKALAAMDDFDEVRVLPVYRHNFTEKRDRLASYPERVHMCRLAFADIPKVTVSESEQECFEQASKGMKDEDIHSLRVGTADLLDMLLQKEPDTQFTFALGSDTFMDLTNWKWKRSREVLSLLEGRFMVLERPQQHCKEVQDRIDQINQDESGHARLVQVPTLDAVSSTMIRSCQDESVLKSMLAPAVFAYMKEQKMYGLAES